MQRPIQKPPAGRPTIASLPLDATAIFVISLVLIIRLCVYIVVEYLDLDPLDAYVWPAVHYRTESGFRIWVCERCVSQFEGE